MPAIDAYIHNSQSLESSAPHAANVTADDDTDLTFVSRAIYVGTGGDLRVITQGGETTTFPKVPAGSEVHVRATRILATGTTASDLVNMW